MKTFFSVLISYILLCIFGAILTSGLIMIYLGCMNYVVGQSLSLFSFEAFRVGLDISLPLVVIFIPMFLVLSLIRHSNKNKLIGIITVILLSVASWVFVMPAFLKIESGKANSSIVTQQRLSSGYFRFADGNLYYFTNVDAENKAEGIAIKTETQNGKQEFSVVHNEQVAFAEADGFSDILVKRVVEMPPMLKNCIMDLQNLSYACVRAFSASSASWIFFCTFALALIFVFAVSDVSQWRLLNAFYVLVSTTVVIKLNCMCYGISFYAKYLPFLTSLDAKMSGVHGFNGAQSILCVFVNIILILIFVALGIIAKITGPKRRAEDY